MNSLEAETVRNPLDVLREVFGHAAFRGQQEDVVRHVSNGGDAVVLFPTGSRSSGTSTRPPHGMAIVRLRSHIWIIPSSMYCSCRR